MKKHNKTSSRHQLKFTEIETKSKWFYPPFFVIYEIWKGDKKLAERVIPFEILLSKEKQKKIIKDFFGGSFVWQK